MDQTSAKAKRTKGRSPKRDPQVKGSSSNSRQATGTLLDSSDQKNRILIVAAKLLRNHGVAATTLRAIAAEVGIEAGSIYYYFSSKNEILSEILDLGVRSVFNEAQSAVEACGPNATHVEKISAAVSAHLHALLTLSDFTSANVSIYRQLPEHIRKMHGKLRREYSTFWEDLFRDARAAGVLRKEADVVMLRRFVLGALNWTVEWFEPTSAKSVDEMSDDLLKLILTGIVTCPSGAPAKSRDKSKSDRSLCRCP